VSVGEYLAARPLINRLITEMPGWRIVVSTTTLTGQLLARKHSPSGDVFYFPFDWTFCVRRALDCVRPSAVVIVETELWPNFIRECRRRRIATVIANGRISPRSFNGYRRVRRFIGGVLRDISLMVMQSPADVTRALELGAEAKRVRLCGNLKYDAIEGSSAESNASVVLRLASIPNLIVAGSTALGEERALLEALTRVRKTPSLENTRLLIAPRHPERFDEVAGLIERSGLTLRRRSETDGSSQGAADVILLDTIGELTEVYKYAAIVFVGGSLVPRGGHNVLEPAACAKPIVVGPYTDNFRQIVSDFSTADAIVQLKASSDEDQAVRLAAELTRLLLDREQAAALGERALSLLKANRGATECTVRAIRNLLSE